MRRFASRPAASRGLTLIEVMVALTIVSITLLAGIKASSALTNNAERLADITAAHWCADNKLNELRLMREFPSVGDTEFTCEQNSRSYRGHLVVRPTLNPSLRRVDARIANEGDQPIVTLTTILPRN